MTATEPAPATAGRAPLADRIGDAACAAFALFTVCAHGVGLLGGNLIGLLATAATVFAAAGALLLWQRRRAVAGGPAPGAAEPQSPELPTWLRVAAASAGGGLIAATAGRVDVGLWWAALALLAIGAAAALARPDGGHDPIRPSGGQHVVLWLLALCGAALALVCHRYAIDDSFYVSVATAAADHPWRPLLSWDPLHGNGDLPLHNPMHRLHSFELLQGAVAYLTGIPAIGCFHFAAAAVGGMLLPLCLARPLRLLLPAAWLPALVGTLLFLVANGDSNNSYGNYAFTRMWQGKSFLLFVWLPLVTAYGLRFAARPSPAGFLWLAAAQIAAVGASSTAVWLAPVTAGLALVANAPWRRRPLAACLTTATGGLASLYPLAIGVAMKPTMAAVASLGAAPQALGEPLANAVALVLGGPRFAAVGLAALLLTWALVPRSGRRYAALAPLLVWALLLAPYSAEAIRSHVTGPSLWRALWALPIPLLVGMAAASPLTWRLPGAARPAAWAAVVTSWALLALWVPIRTTVDSGPGSPPFVNRVAIHWPGLKVDGDAYAAAAALVDALPDGAAVLAPERVARWIPTFHQPPRPLLVRALYLKVQRRNLPDGEYARRVRVTQYVSGEVTRPAAASAFRRALGTDDIRGVCLAAAAPAEARRLLERRGFVRDTRGRHYEIWILPGSA